MSKQTGFSLLLSLLPLLPRSSPTHSVQLSCRQKNAAAKITNPVDYGIGTRLGAQTILHGCMRIRAAYLTLLSILYYCTELVH